MSIPTPPASGGQTGDDTTNGGQRTNPPLEQRSDTDLLRLAQLGGESAFRDLFHRHNAKIVRYVRSLGAKPVDSEDVAQHVWLELFRHVQSIRPDGFEAWLFTAAKNKYIDHYRKARRFPLAADTRPDPEDGSDSPAAEAVDKAPSALAAVIEKTARQRLRDVLDAMPAQEAILLMDAFTTEELERMLGVERGTIFVRRNRAFERALYLLTERPVERLIMPLAPAELEALLSRVIPRAYTLGFAGVLEKLVRHRRRGSERPRRMSIERFLELLVECGATDWRRIQQPQPAAQPGVAPAAWPELPLVLLSVARLEHNARQSILELMLGEYLCKPSNRRRLNELIALVKSSSPAGREALEKAV